MAGAIGHRPGVTVLMFHGLCEELPRYAAYIGGRTCIVTVAEFSRLVRWCARNVKVLRLEELESHLRAGGSSPAVMITFDDALASVADFAVPVLEEYDVSGVVFATTDWTDSGRTPDIFLLERELWERVPAHLVIDIGDDTLEFQVCGRASIPGMLERLWNDLFSRRFPPLSLSSDAVEIDGQKWQRSDELEDRQFWYPASWASLRDGARSGVLEIGSHMVSHVPLNWLSDDEAEFQLASSHQRLSDMIEAPVLGCSYPHGFHNERTAELAARHYKWSFANTPGRVHRDTPRAALPRYHVPGEAPRRAGRVLKLARLTSPLADMGFELGRYSNH